jgi:hypothetical protein
MLCEEDDLAIRGVAVEGACAFVVKASGRQRCCAPLEADGARLIDAPERGSRKSGNRLFARSAL